MTSRPSTGQRGRDRGAGCGREGRHRARRPCWSHDARAAWA